MKNSNELDFLLNEIQIKTRKTLTEIAESINRSDAHLSRLRTGPADKIDRTVKLLREKYKEVLKGATPSTEEYTNSQKVIYFEAAMEVVLKEIAWLRASANHTVFQEELQSLETSVENTIKRNRSRVSEKSRR